MTDATQTLYSFQITALPEHTSAIRTHQEKSSAVLAPFRSLQAL